MALIDSLNWRYATKSYDKTKKVAKEDLEKILEAVRLTPTSNGLQPFQILVISNQDLKEKIVPIAWGQQNVADSSHLLVFATWDKYSDERIDEVFNQVKEERNLPEGALDNYINTLKQGFLSQSAEENFVNTARQAYIVLGTAILQAAELNIDSTPMEGFNNADLDELLNLKEQGLKSVVMLAVGYRNTENDWLANMKKVRKSKENLIQYID